MVDVLSDDMSITMIFICRKYTNYILHFIIKAHKVSIEFHAIEI